MRALDLASQLEEIQSDRNIWGEVQLLLRDKQIFVFFLSVSKQNQNV